MSEGMGEMRYEYPKAFTSTSSREETTSNTRLEEMEILKWIIMNAVCKYEMNPSVLG